MYLHDHRLPHVLQPADYSSAEQYRRELRHVFLDAWHLVGTTADLRGAKGTLDLTLLGHPLRVQLVGDELRVRYSPHDRRGEQASPWRVARCGQLVFVSLAEDGPSLAAQLGEFYDVCQERFGDEARQSLSWDVEYPVNWKIPIENSTEAYHVPAVHPGTFKESPSEARSRHRLEAGFTSFGTRLPFSPHSRFDAVFQRLEGSFVRWMGGEPTTDYWLHHVFPSLLLTFTDTLSLCQTVLPTSPTTARGLVRQFGCFADARHRWQRTLAAGWGRIAAAITRQILSEDMRLYPAIQRGLSASRNRGVLGCCEERVHAFQCFIRERCDKPSAEPATTVVAETDSAHGVDGLPCETTLREACR
ncbi:MAG TPA: RHO alpha subunit C-terminal catalytic domain-containing protein [Pirellulales bacterium]|nr:RHO alpha subunit C-terminal catalytic domain-containing protein [Pirellulales bacterium]